MPLIGVISPSHKERKGDAPGRYPDWAPVDETLQEALTASPKWGPWNYELIAALVAEQQERGARLSVTALTGGCMRGNIVERKEDYIGSLDNLYPSLRGTLIHRTLEGMHRADSLAEWRFYATVNGQSISGSPDLITHDTLWDWKTTENPPTFDYMYVSHKLQLQFNRFLFNNAEKWDAPEGVDPDTIPLDPHQTRLQHLAIVYLGPKGPKVIETVKTTELKTANGSTRKLKVPDVWSDDRVMAELTPRMEAWKLAWDAYPEWPDGLESYPGWEGPPQWQCSGAPICYLPACVAKRLPSNLVWDRRS